MTISPSTTKPTITLDQWLARAGTWKKATKELVLLWFENELGTQKQLANHLSLTPGAITKQKAKLIESGQLLTATMANTGPKKKIEKVNSPVENSDQEVEKVNVTVHEPAVAAAAVQRPFAPAETAAPVSVPAVKRPSKPKDLQMLDSQQRMVKERLLPLAKQLVQLTEQVKEEKARLHGRWVKDNIVFATGFQRCADYWNDCNYFAEFAEVFGDDRIKTYADVLATIEQRFKRNAEHMQAIQYATGCTPDPNKKDL
jgi:hypothetical protein